MAYVCPSCHRVHPKGAVGCEQAREMIDRDVREFRQKVIAHKQVCDCPDPEGHVRKRERGDPKDLVFRRPVAGRGL